MIDMRPDPNGAILISTFSDEKSLIDLSANLVMEKRICACVNYTMVKSVYVWNSSLHQEKEYLAFFKTTLDNVERLKTEIKNNHPYDVPEIVVVNMSDVSTEYFNWMYKNTRNSVTGVGA